MIPNNDGTRMYLFILHFFQFQFLYDMLKLFELIEFPMNFDLDFVFVYINESLTHKICIYFRYRLRRKSVPLGTYSFHQNQKFTKSNRCFSTYSFVEMKLNIFIRIQGWGKLIFFCYNSIPVH